MRHSRMRESIIIAAIGALALLLFVPIMALLAIGLEDNITKWEIQNPHVNKRYAGWKEVTLYDDQTIKIPKDWTFEDNDGDGVYSLTDGDGNLWAVGTQLDSTSRFSNNKDFISSALSVQPENITFDYREPGMNINGSSFYTTAVQCPSKSTYYYILSLSKAWPSFEFILFSDIIQSPSDFDIAEAIMYSYEYEYYGSK